MYAIERYEKMKTAIEFWGKIEDGVIKLPAEYLDKYGRLDTRVLVTVNVEHDLSAQKARLKDLFAQARQHNIFSAVSSPVDWQKDLRNEWD